MSQQLQDKTTNRAKAHNTTRTMDTTMNAARIMGVPQNHQTTVASKGGGGNGPGKGGSSPRPTPPPNGPSKTGQPSGPGRGNNPPKR